MTASIPQDRTDPLLRKWQGTPAGPLPELQKDPAAPSPVAPIVEAPVDKAPRFTVTNQAVTILQGGSNYVFKGHQTTHRIHKDANGVEFIYWNRVMQALPNLNVHVVRREIVKG